MKNGIEESGWTEDDLEEASASMDELVEHIEKELNEALPEFRWDSMVDLQGHEDPQEGPDIFISFGAETDPHFMTMEQLEESVNLMESLLNAAGREIDRESDPRISALNTKIIFNMNAIW